MDLSNYRYFVLDASFHKAPLQLSLVEALAAMLQQENSQCRLFAAATIQSDLKRNLRLLDRHDPKRAELYRGNIELLKNSGIRPEILAYSDYDLKDQQAHHDTRSLIRRLCKQYAPQKILLLSCDDALFEELTVFDSPISICHLCYNKIYDSAALSQMKQNFELKTDDRLITGITRKNPAVCDGDAVQLDLDGCTEHSGNEAKIYKVAGGWKGREHILAKIYNKHSEERDATATGPRTACYSYAQAENIQRLCAKGLDLPALFPWAAMPLEPVYDRLIQEGEVDQDRIVGHLMAEFQGVTALERTFLCINTGDRKLADAVEACLTLVEQALYMSSYGIHISDVSDNNFGIRYNGSDPVCDTVYMFDAGSFAYKHFFSSGMNGDVRPVRHPQRPTCKKEMFAYCSELLYVQVLHMLTRGLAIDTDSRTLPFMNPKDPCYPLRYYIPRNLWLLLQSLYKGKKECGFSLEILAEELYAALCSLRRSGITYEEALRQGDHPVVDWPQEPDILPCKTVLQSAASDNNPGRYAPGVHRAESRRARTEHCDAMLQVQRDLLPPVKCDAPSKAQLRLRHGLIVLFILLALVALDMLYFAAAEFQFEWIAWLQDRFGGIRDLISGLGTILARWRQ